MKATQKESKANHKAKTLSTLKDKEHKSKKKRIAIIAGVGVLLVGAICFSILMIAKNTQQPDAQDHKEQLELSLKYCLDAAEANLDNILDGEPDKENYEAKIECYKKYNVDGYIDKIIELQRKMDGGNSVDKDLTEDENTKANESPKPSTSAQQSVPQPKASEQPQNHQGQAPAEQGASSPQINCKEALDYLNGKYWASVNAAYQWLEDAADEWAHSQTNKGEGYIEAYKITYKQQNQYQVDNLITREYSSATATAIDAGCSDYINNYSW